MSRFAELVTWPQPSDRSASAQQAYFPYSALGIVDDGEMGVILRWSHLPGRDPGSLLPLVSADTDQDPALVVPGLGAVPSVAAVRSLALSHVCNSARGLAAHVKVWFREANHGGGTGRPKRYWTVETGPDDHRDFCCVGADVVKKSTPETWLWRHNPNRSNFFCYLTLSRAADSPSLFPCEPTTKSL
jgi:hypothetical protein